MSCEIGASECVSGGTPASQKNTWLPAHMLNAELDVLKTMRSVECPRRHDVSTVPSALATVAGAGPNNSAVVMKNVSETVMLAETDPVFIENEPVKSASPANSSHS